MQKYISQTKMLQNYQKYFDFYSMQHTALLKIHVNKFIVITNLTTLSRSFPSFPGVRVMGYLKGQSNEIFYLHFFHRWTSPKPLTRYLKTFRIQLRIRGDIRDFLLTLRYYLQRRVILPVLFNTQSCDSPVHYSGESLFVRIIRINTRLSFNTESRYSPYCLLCRVLTPRIVYSEESLLIEESYFKNSEGLPLPLKEK